jgi:hypothetical protein
VGTITEGANTFDLSYKDAHLELATTGWFEDSPAPTTSDNGFGSSSTSITHGVPDDTMTIDWQVNPGAQVNGRHHIGAEFHMDTLGFNNAAVRVKSATLTDVYSADLGGYSTSELVVPGPTSFHYKPVNSVDWEFSVDDPFITGPVNFTNVAFYKTALEPALSDLTAANFPALTKTLLHVEPPFILNPGEKKTVTVPNVDPPEWIIAFYTTDWIDPTLTLWWQNHGGVNPVIVDVNQWVAGEVVPEPASLSLMALGIGGLLLRRRAGTRSGL